MLLISQYTTTTLSVSFQYVVEYSIFREAFGHYHNTEMSNFSSKQYLSVVTIAISDFILS